jgi:hypothetical protein
MHSSVNVTGHSVANGTLALIALGATRLHVMKPVDDVGSGLFADSLSTAVSLSVWAETWPESDFSKTIQGVPLPI